MFNLSKQTTSRLLLLITLLSFWLRVWGIQFGLPFAYHPDEQQYILPAIGVIQGNFQPLAHYNPALYPYFIGLIYSLIYYSFQLIGLNSHLLQLDWSPAISPWTAFWIYLARYITASVGVLTMLMVYHLGRRAYNRLTGIGAAWFFAVTFLPTREAHFAVNDAPVALMVALTLYLCIPILRRAQWQDSLKIGLALGLAAATKYSAGLLAVPIGVAYLLGFIFPHPNPLPKGEGVIISPLPKGEGAGVRVSPWERVGVRALHLLMVGPVALLTYALASPYTFIQWDKFKANFSENLESARVGFQGLDLDPSGGAIFYLKGLVWGLGGPFMLLTLIAILYLLWRRRPIDLFMLTFPLFGFFYMQRQEMYFVRWLMPFIPSLCVITAEGVRVSSSHLMTLSHQVTLQKQRAPVIFVVIYGLIALPSMATAMYADYIFSQPDTRSQALQWISNNIPINSGLAAEVLSPPWGPPLAMPGLEVGPYRFAPVPSGGVAELSPEQYRAWGVEYVVASSFHYNRPLRDKAHQAQLAANMTSLAAQADLVATFTPYQADYQGYFYHDQLFGPANDTWQRQQPGPIILIYHLR